MSGTVNMERIRRQLDRGAGKHIVCPLDRAPAAVIYYTDITVRFRCGGGHEFSLASRYFVNFNGGS